MVQTLVWNFPQFISHFKYLPLMRKILLWRLSTEWRSICYGQAQSIVSARSNSTKTVNFIFCPMRRSKSCNMTNGVNYCYESKNTMCVPYPFEVRSSLDVWDREGFVWLLYSNSLSSMQKIIAKNGQLKFYKRFPFRYRNSTSVNLDLENDLPALDFSDTYCNLQEKYHRLLETEN